MLDCRVGGVSRLRIDKAGNIIANTGGAGGTSGLCMFDTNSKFYAGAGQIIVLSNGSLCGAFASSFYYAQSTGGLGISNDVLLYRDSAGTLAQRNGTNAQTLRIYGTYTDASNGRYFQIGSTTAGIFTLTATGNGTGASGNLLKLTAPILLPSSSVTLATNGDLAFEATSNTSLTIRYRGSDGTTRSAIIALI
jgi:hypothetical protein